MVETMGTLFDNVRDAQLYEVEYWLGAGEVLTMGQVAELLDEGLLVSARELMCDMERGDWKVTGIESSPENRLEIVHELYLLMDEIVSRLLRDE